MLKLSQNQTKTLSTVYPDIHNEVIEACKKGDRKAQYELYKLYSKAMYNICFRICNSSAEAEDVLQEAFVEVFKKLHTFKGESTFGAWLKRVVVNRAINQIKKRKLELVSVEKYDFKEETENNEEDIKLQVEQVNKAIQLLPDGFRTVLTLYLIEGYDHKEIGEILNITESTSKSQFNRAKKRLLEIIKSIN